MADQSLPRPAPGAQYDRLTILSAAPSRRRLRYWLCRCSCGTVREVRETGLLSGTRSCGCLRIEMAARRFSQIYTTHGMSKSAEYQIWADIVKRCRNPKHEHYKDYGGRGIDICEEWRQDFSKFLDHIGRRPSNELSVDRINNDGNYEPGNVRWATRITQRRNCQPQRIHMLTFDGKTMCLADWAKERGMKYDTLKMRINRYGLTPEQALTRKVRIWRKTA